MYRRRKVQAEPKEPIPETLKEFGYQIKENGEVRSITRDEPYVFDYMPKDRAYNEARYQKFISLLGDVVEERLQAEPYNFKKAIVPVGADPKTDIHSYIYMTPNAMTTTDKLLILIPGNHTRVGQWSRRIMCDDNINTGSMMQIAGMVMEKGYEVMILNPNANFWYDGKAHEVPQIHTSTLVEVPENENPEKHCQYVFHHFVRNAKAEKMAVIAMAWGGHSFALTLNTEFDFMKKHVKAVAMTDSVHVKDMIKADGARTFMFDNCVNWAVSDKKRGTVVQDMRFGCTNISSELEIADYTLTTMLDDILKFIYIKMGDIEVDEEAQDEDEDEDAIRELTEEELADLDNVDIISTQ